MSLFSFLKVASRDIKVGAVMPSSSFAVRNILKRIPAMLTTVVEYGPGDGVLTRELLKRMTSDGKLLALETNPKFAAALDALDDPRFILAHDDATLAAIYAQRHGLGPCDLVISGIPFSMVSKETRDRMVAMTFDLLKPGGVFLVYQTSPLMVPYLKKKFAVKTHWEPLNVPPYFIMRAEKKI